MIGLIRKELKQMIPYICLVVLLGGSTLAYNLILFHPQAIPVNEIWEFDLGSEFVAMVYFVIGFSLALGLLVREQDERTVDFLDALPISRGKILWAKVFAAAFVLFLFPLSDAISKGVCFHLIDDSLRSGIPWQPLGALLLCGFVLIFFFFCFGLALSFLRRFAWLVALIALGMLMLLNVTWPGFDQISPIALGEPPFHGQQIEIPWLSVYLTLGTSLFWLFLAGLLFRPSDSGGVSGYKLFAESRLASGLLIGISVIIVGGGLLLSLIGWMLGGEDPEEFVEETGPVFIERPETAMASAYFGFTYPSAMETATLRLSARADKAADQVIDFMDTEIDEQIEIEISSRMQHIHAGLAVWNKIRIAAGQVRDTDEAVAILGHELTHVLIDRISDRRLEDDFNSNKLFHEGFATYLEFKFFRNPDRLEDYRKRGAALHDRESIRFEELIDYSAFKKKFSGELIYPLGERFIQAMVDQYGEEAPVKIVQAFGREKAPEDLSGLVLWRDVMQACSYDLDRVIDRFYLNLDADVKAHRAWIDALPDPKMQVDVQAFEITFKVSGVGDGDSVQVVLRPASDTDEQHYFAAAEKPDGSFAVSRAAFPGNRLWYQILLIREGEEHPISGLWREIRF